MNFRLIFIAILVLVVSLQILTIVTFRKFLNRKGLKGAKLNLLAFGPFALFIIPLLLLIIDRSLLVNMRGWLFNIYIIPFYVFQTSVLFIGLYLLILKLLKLPLLLINFLFNHLAFIKTKWKNFKEKKAVVKFDSSRRKFITGTTAAVSGYAFIASGIGIIGRDNFEVVETSIAINNLPPELKGTTLTLITDIHSGPYMDTEMMKDYTAAINSLNSNVIVIAGDMTNSQQEEIYPFTSAFRDLKAEHGVYATLGNHDYFSNADYIAEAVSKGTQIKMLRNDAQILNIKGKSLCLLGSEDTRESGSRYDPVVMGYLNSTFDKAKNVSASQGIDYEQTPKILLCHKPYFFNELDPYKMDLILSGHTHGGQVVLAQFGKLNLSIAATVSPYIQGLYKNSYSQMYVSRGIGVVGLPIRLNCRPEITKITLV